jgi:hypothetical protein
MLGDVKRHQHTILLHSFPGLEYIVSFVSISRESYVPHIRPNKNEIAKNIQQRGFASGHPPDY